MLGRHFLVYSDQDPTVKRQYTICSSMTDQVHTALLKLAQGVLDNADINFDYSIMLGLDQSTLDLTLKTYDVTTGLATRIHKSLAKSDNAKDGSKEAVAKSENGALFYVKGPMGRGLNMSPKGQHVAFVAGTGVLVLLDLVSHLLILNSFEAQGKGLPEEM